MIQKIRTLKNKKDNTENIEQLGSIRNRIWKYFAIYIVVILFVIWLMQNVFLNTFYKNMKITEIAETGKVITEEYLENKTIRPKVLANTVDNSTIVQVVNGEGKVIYPVDWYGIFYSASYNKEIISSILAEIPKTPGSNTLYDLKTIDEHSQSFLYLSYLGLDSSGSDLYLMIASLVEPIDSTVSIMRKQFPFIIGIIFIIGLIVSYFVSKKLSQPVMELNQTAKVLATGKYDIEFPSSDVYEIDQLSGTLNYATKELQKMDEMRVSIVANVSHDLKTPLTVIKSYSEMIKDISGETKESRDAHLDVIITEADRLTYMVNSILNVSKLEMQMDELNMVEVSLRDLTKEIIDRLDVLRAKHNFEFIIQGDSEGKIMADRSMIDQVIYNFATNAVNFIGKDKKIIFDIEEDDDFVTYSVIDHGRGIAEGEKEKIWDRYYTDHHNHVRNLVGTGLGLHIVRVILKKHNFKYGVDSELGKGSRFYFTAPKIQNN